MFLIISTKFTKENWPKCFWDSVTMRLQYQKSLILIKHTELLALERLVLDTTVRNFDQQHVYTRSYRNHLKKLAISIQLALYFERKIIFRF